MDIPKINKINIIDVDLDGVHIHGDSKSLLFDKVGDMHGFDDEPDIEPMFEMTWQEVLEACEEWFKKG